MSEELNIYRLHKKRLPLYPVDIVFSASGEKLEKYFESDYNEKVSSGGYTKVAFVDDIFTIGIFLEAEDHTIPLSFIAHECFHAAVRACGFLGIKIDVSNDEPAAYIISWLFDWILETLRKDYKLTKKQHLKIKEVNV